MKQYKLLKDLPTFKAGDIFELEYTGDLTFVEHGDTHKTAVPLVVAYTKLTLEKFPNILKDWFEEIPEKPKTVEDLKEGDKWYYISYNSMCHYVASSRVLNCINTFREVGNVFLTGEEAEKELARRKAKQVLLRDTKGFKPDWPGCSVQVYYDYDKHLLDYGRFSLNDGTLRFATEEDATASIETHEKEWKIYLGAEE